MHGLVVQWLGGEQGPCSWVQAELPQAEGVGAAQECVGQLVLLVSVHCTDLHDFSTSWRVFRDVHLIILLRELWPVVVGVNDTDKDLRGEESNHKYNISAPDINFHYPNCL